MMVGALRWTGTPHPVCTAAGVLRLAKKNEEKNFRACDKVSLNVTAQSRAVGQLNYDRSTELLCKLQRPPCHQSLSISLAIHAGRTTEAVGPNFPRSLTTEEC